VFVQALGGAPAPPRALTTGAVHSAFPVWSPDGRRLAFVREEQNQGREVIWDAERDQMTPVGDAFIARMYLAPQWDRTGKTLVVAALSLSSNVSTRPSCSTTNHLEPLPGACSISTGLAKVGNAGKARSRVRDSCAGGSALVVAVTGCELSDSFGGLALSKARTVYE